MKDFTFVIIIMFMYFGVGIMTEIKDYDYDINKTGIMYQENNNIVLKENNRYYDYDIDFNLNESYLKYNPVKKGGFLDNYNKHKNLAIPDLTGKEYLGNGDYELSVNSSLNNLIYNVFNGEYRSDIVSVTGGIVMRNFIYNLSGSYIFSVYGQNSNIRLEYQLDGGEWVSFAYSTNNSFNYRNVTLTPTTSIGIRFRSLGNEIKQENIKIQLEQGLIATDYEVPYIPPLKIEFKGSNQVEYINPFEEQTIKIDDINNVNNIEFELLNTNNPVVFNFNITTNPNLPFVRFYNNQTKLLYDFTDIDEMNKIGNNLVGSRSNFSNIFNTAIDLVDMFYKGYQKLFGTKNIKDFFDGVLRVAWPIIPPSLRPRIV